MSNNHANVSECSCAGKSAEDKSEAKKIIVGAGIFAAGVIVSQIASVNQYITLAVFVVSYLILGGEIVLRAARNIVRGKVFDENFLMSTATLGAFAIGEYPEAVAVMLFYQVGEYFQEAAVKKSKKSIRELMDIRPDYANIIRDGAEVKVDPASVNIGDEIIVKPGEKIPLDGVVASGGSLIDTSALTGESVPRNAKAGDSVLSGCINKTGVLTIRVTKKFGDSTVAKIIDLVENASAKKAPAEKFITTFSRYYTPVVVALAALIAIVPPLFFENMQWNDWIYRGFVFLVISCPCALVISIPLSYFCGIGLASKRGILVKGGNYLEALANIDTIVFDKTGTLTKGVFKVTNVQTANNFSQDDLLAYAAMAEAYSNHPIAQSIQNACGDIDKSQLSDYTEISGYGVSVNSNGKIILCGNYKLMQSKNILCDELAGVEHIGTKIYVAVDNKFAGSIIISDEIKDDSRETVIALKQKGVRKTVMLTGDNNHIANIVAKELCIDEVHGDLLPHQKVEMLELTEKTKTPAGKLAFVGDGINDAPVLARADVGIAMGALGSDAAIEAADVVLMTDEPKKLIAAIDVARFTNRKVKQNIIFALGAKIIFLTLGAFGVAGLWEAVFADVGVALIAVFNASRNVNEKG